MNLHNHAALGNTKLLRYVVLTDKNEYIVNGTDNIEAGYRAINLAGLLDEELKDVIKRGIMKRKSKHYYPNNIRAVAESPPEYFPAMPFDVFYAHYVRNWLLPSSHECVIRATSL